MFTEDMKIVADENIPFVAECFASLGQVRTMPGREITPETVSQADILLVRSITPVNEKLLAGSNLKFAATATIGYEHIDLQYLQSRNIGFASAPGSNANSVAEYVIAALLEIGQKDKISLEGKSIGIIGAGNVGSRLAKKCDAMGLTVILNDPPLQRKTGDKKYRPLAELFSCDIITLHTPLTMEGDDKTFHLADEKFFNPLKKNSIFINTSRGGVVDSSALKAAIKSGRLLAAGLDVWENEPNIDTELLQLVALGTPHIAGYSLDGKIAGMIMIYNSACNYFRVEPKYNISDFLPEPQVKSLQPDKAFTQLQDVINYIVKKIYPISRDDNNLRQLLNESETNRGAYFDRLRKQYPVRREFQNTELILNLRTQNTEHGTQNSKLITIFKGLGFKVT